MNCLNRGYVAAIVYHGLHQRHRGRRFQCNDSLDVSGKYEIFARKDLRKIQFVIGVESGFIENFRLDRTLVI